MRSQLHLQSAIYLSTLIWTALLRMQGHFHRSQTLYNYMDPIMKQPVQTFGSLGIDKTKVSIIEDERHSYGALLAEFDKKKLDMQAVMDWPITSKPRSICRLLSKSLFRNNLQLLSPVPSSSSALIGIDRCIVDAMRVVRMITIKDLKPFTSTSWVIRVVDYLKSLPGTILQMSLTN